MAPEAVQPMVGHLQKSTKIGRLALVQEEVRARGIAVDPVATLEKPQRHESVEKVAGRARVETKPVPHSFTVLRVLREFGEHLHLDCAQQNLRCPEAKTDLQ